MKVYKVVSTNARGDMFSHAGSYGYTLPYELGKTTKPTFGFVYAFRRLSDAKRFRGEYGGSDSRILRCDAIVTRHRGHRAYCGVQSNFGEFWKMGALYNNLKWTVTAPKGTVYCREITPERIVS